MSGKIVNWKDKIFPISDFADDAKQKLKFDLYRFPMLKLVHPWGENSLPLDCTSCVHSTVYSVHGSVHLDVPRARSKLFYTG